MLYYIVIFSAENRATSRWNVMEMTDAKKALKILFEKIAVEGSPTARIKSTTISW